MKPKTERVQYSVHGKEGRGERKRKRKCERARARERERGKERKGERRNIIITK